MGFLHVDQPLEARFDEHGELTDLDGLVVGPRLVDEHGLDVVSGASQADPRIWIEAPRGLVSPLQDVPGPVRDLDHGDVSNLACDSRSTFEPARLTDPAPARRAATATGMMVNTITANTTTFTSGNC